jgi:glycosyltransferase involved in cell wall biosynthesis
MNLPSLSVMVPNYNHGPYLARCIIGVQGQSVQPLEVIVVDDASTDSSLDVLNQLARDYPKLQVLRNTVNQGVVKTLNRGLELLHGDYVFLPSADDEPVPGLFETSLRLLAEHPRAGLSCSINTWRVPDTGLTWNMGAGIASRPGYLSPEDLVRIGRRGKLPIPAGGAIIRRKALLEAGGYLPELRWHVDWYAIMVIAFRYGLCYTKEPLFNIYLASGSYSRKGMASLEQREVLTHLLERLSRPECADVAPRIRDSAALALFGMPLIRLLIKYPQYRRFLTPHLVLWAIYRGAELAGKRILPEPLARLCVRLLYHHKGPPASGA